MATPDPPPHPPWRPDPLGWGQGRVRVRRGRTNTRPGPLTPAPATRTGGGPGADRASTTVGVRQKSVPRRRQRLLRRSLPWPRAARPRPAAPATSAPSALRAPRPRRRDGSVEVTSEPEPLLRPGAAPTGGGSRPRETVTETATQKRVGEPLRRLGPVGQVVEEVETVTRNR